MFGRREQVSVVDFLRGNMRRLWRRQPLMRSGEIRMAFDLNALDRARERGDMVLVREAQEVIDGQACTRRVYRPRNDAN